MPHLAIRSTRRRAPQAPPQVHERSDLADPIRSQTAAASATGTADGDKLLRIPDRSWKPWVGTAAVGTGATAIFSTLTGAVSLANPAVHPRWWNRGGSRAVFSGHPTWDGLGSMAGSLFTSIGSGIQMAGGLYHGTRAIAGSVHGARYRRALATRIRHAERKPNRATGNELDALKYAQDAITKVRRDAALDMVPSALFLAAGTTAVSTAGMGSLPAMACGLSAVGLRAAKVAGDRVLQWRRRQRAKRFATLIRREADAAAERVPMRRRDAAALAGMRRVRSLRAKSRRGDALTRRERWALATAVNEDAATHTARARRHLTAAYIAKTDGAERAFILGAVGITEARYRTWMAEAPQDADPGAYVRKQLLARMRRI